MTTLQFTKGNATKMGLTDLLIITEYGLLTLLFIFVAFCFGYGFYAVLGSLAKHYKRKKKPYPKWLIGLTWVFVVFVNVPFNVIIVTFWFRQLPRQFLTTTRMKMWRKEYGHKHYNTELSRVERRRVIFADWLCDEMLDYHDITGDHC